MSYTVEELKKIIDDIYDDAVTIRRAMHENPELGEQEVQTEKLICAELSKLGIDYREHVAGHGVVGLIPGVDAETAIALRADIDALPVEECTGAPFSSKVPGVMHACGHDMHTAILLGTAMLLKRLPKPLPCSVKLFFQPSEETIGGAEQMIAEGCMENPKVSAVLGLHVRAELPTGQVIYFPNKMNASATEFEITACGKSTHGAYPEGGNDTVLIASQIVISIQSIVSRMISATEPVVITIGEIHGGTAANIIPSEVKMHGTIRTLDEKTIDIVKNLITRVAENTAAVYGGHAKVDFGGSYPVLANDKKTVEVLEKAAIKCLGEENVIIEEIARMGADDFAYFSNAAHGAYFDLGVYNPDLLLELQGEIPEEPYPLHNARFLPDEEAIKTGILLEATGLLALVGEF